MSFSGFWDKVGGLLGKAAMWAVTNPQVIQDIINAAKK